MKQGAWSLKKPLSEADILCLQDMFLTQGLHHLQVKDIPTGRRLIETFLHSLGIYHDIACLTTADIPLERHIVDIQTELLEIRASSGNHADLEEFFIERFCYDFLWIEQSDDLQACPWYKTFEQKIANFNIDQHIPIISLSYD